MPQSSIKLIWSLSSCAFCPRNGVRTCQIRPGKLLPKLSAALDLEEEVLSAAEGICTCCLTDIDMIIRALAIKGAMKDYFLNDFPLHGKEISTQSQQCGGDNSLCSRYHYENERKVFPTENGMKMSEVKPEIPIPSLHPPSLIAMPSIPNQEPQSSKKHMMYQCLLCDKVAGSKSHCMEHLICHSAVRPFSCAHCRKTYKSRKACREHLVVMHGVEKMEAQLHDHMIINQEELKQLENVCSQYKKIYAGAKPGKGQSPNSQGESSTGIVKAEPKENTMGSKSYWLYHGTDAPTAVSTQPPPLIRCAPSSTSTPELPSSSTDQVCQPALSPPAKRNRKGTPHKVVMDITDDDWDGLGGPPSFQFAFDGELSNSSSLLDHDSDSTTDYSMLPDVSDKSTSKKSDGEYFSDQGDTPTKPEWPSLSQQFVSSDNSEGQTVNWSACSPSSSTAKRMVPPCEICGRSFPTKEKMADHKRSHSEIKQFSCLKCNRFFKYRRGVTNHLKEVHRLKDRTEISNLVASHEVGCIPVKDAAGKKKWVKTTDLASLTSETETAALVSQKVIEDTLLTLVDVQDDDEQSAMLL